MKYIFVTGGVVSSLGKGLTAASLGTLLENRGLKVALQKFDPYLNVDPGTMNPYQHGEVYVLDDGAETDLDLGHYERFTNVQADAAEQPDQRPGVSDRAQQRARGQIPRQDRAGHPARDGRDQEAHPRAGRADRGRRDHHRDRRHDRRHRGPAVPGGHPGVRARGRLQQRHFRPRHLRAVHQGRRRAEDASRRSNRSPSCAKSASPRTSWSAAARSRWTRRCGRRFPCSATCPSRR